MSITVEELRNMNPDTYQLIDIRSESEIAHGAIPGATVIPGEEISSSEQTDKTKKLIICCSRGRNSIDLAAELCEKGLDAESLEGGYIAWLMDYMKRQEEADFAKNVEQSLRKTYKKRIWSKFCRAINTYELVKPGDKIAVCISGGKDSMLMAKLFQELKRHNKFEFEVKYLVMDPGYNEANRRIIEENARRLNIPVTFFESNIFDAVYEIENSPCYLWDVTRLRWDTIMMM